MLAWLSQSGQAIINKYFEVLMDAPSKHATENHIDVLVSLAAVFREEGPQHLDQQLL